MIKSVFTRSLLVLAVCAGLPACDGWRRAVGIEKAPPDEFMVVQRAPLAAPPDFTLRPPAPGAVRPQEGTAREQAKAVLAGPDKRQAIATTNRDSMDVDLLRRAGVDQVQKDIRDLVDKESLAQSQAGTGLTDKIMFWDKTKPVEKETLNPDSEAARLKRAKGGTDGVSPRIDRSGGTSGGGSWLSWPF